MIRLIALIGLVSCLNAFAFDSTAYRFRKELNGAVESEGLARFELDPEIFRSTTDRFTDLRLVEIFEDGESEIPYLASRVDRYVPPKTAQLIQTEVISFVENSDDSVEFQLRFIEEDTPLQAAKIDFRTPLRNFEKSVTIEASRDGSEWRTLHADALLFDRERFLDFRKTSLELPKNDARFFKVRIADATDEQRSLVREISRSAGECSGTSVTETATVATRPFRIDALKFLTADRDAIDVDHERSYPVEIERIVQNEESGCTEIFLGTDRAPLTSLTLTTDDRNFRREVLIQVPDSSDSWQTIKHARIFRYHIGEFQEEALTVEFDSRRSERVRILIENGDSPALSITEIGGRGDIHEVLFLTEPGMEWAVYYGAGNNAINAPRYDTAALRLAKGRGLPAGRFRLGNETENPDFESGFLRPGWTEQKWVLWSVIAMIVAALIVVLLRAGRKIETIEL